MITATVIVTIPPNSSDIPIPIAVVIDLGSIVTYCWWLNPNNIQRTKIPVKLANVPDNIPQTTATLFSLVILIAHIEVQQDTLLLASTNKICISHLRYILHN